MNVSLGNIYESIKAKVIQSCFHRTDKEINKEINKNIEYGNTQQQELKGGMAGQKGQTVESCRNSCEHSWPLISPSQKKGRMEETHITVPSPTIHKYFLYEKQTFTRKHFLKKASVENLFMLSDIIITQLNQEPS